MGIGQATKKIAIGVAKVAGSTILGAAGVASALVEYVGGGSGIEILEEMGHGLKTASFNGVRKMWGAESVEFDHSSGDSGRRKAREIQKNKERIVSQQKETIHNYERRFYNNEKNSILTSECANKTQLELEQEKTKMEELKATLQAKHLNRRTDEELSKDKTGLDKPAREFDHDDDIPLSIAMHRAAASPGVYILWLNGSVMKCGRSSQAGGVRKRLLEYYRLDYDKRAKEGEYWAVTEENREDIMVSWQCCPISKCHELEYKLFQKYGKGPWAHRAPASCDDDSWELLI